MGEIIDLEDISKITLWIDSDIAYKVTGYKLLSGKNPCIKATLQRIEPFPHLTDDDWTFTAFIDNVGNVTVDLDLYTQNQPEEDNE